MEYAPRPTIAEGHPVVQLAGQRRVLAVCHGDEATGRCAADPATQVQEIQRFPSGRVRAAPRSDRAV